jgi:hypothetical protein
MTQRRSMRRAIARLRRTKEASVLQLSACNKCRKIWASNLCFVSAVVLVLNGLLLAQSGPKTFASPEEAGHALFAAAQAGDQVAMLDIFGPAGNEIISTGDNVEDQKTRDQFVAKYAEMHRLVQEPDGTTTLYVGAENWPLPVPLVDAGGAWHFDTETGKKDILFRRIGENEYATMDVCNALVDAQKEYRSQSRDGGVQQYAQKLNSDEGRHNGLYWKTAADEPESPIGPLVAYAAGAGAGQPSVEERAPFHGYYYRILTAQAKTAQSEAKNYIVNGEMTGGFAIVAYPADYRSSGVMTFIVDQTGVIYQKDLGNETSVIASGMTGYAPDKTWTKAE